MLARMERMVQGLALDACQETFDQQEESGEVVKVQKVFLQFIERLEMPELCLKERLGIAN
jgi:hypothetical protein